MFTLKAAIGKVVLTSETYDTKNAANERRFEKRAAMNGQQYFILKAANSEQIRQERDLHIGQEREEWDRLSKAQAPARPELRPSLPVPGIAVSQSSRTGLVQN